jgi:tetratricopeptide (TPR) repeat protein
VLAAMAKEPADRPATLVAVVDALAGASTIRVPVQQRRRRARVALAIAGALVVAAAGALAVAQPWRGEARITLAPASGGKPYVVATDFASESGPDEAWRSDALNEVLEPLLEAGDSWLLTNRTEAQILAIDLELAARDGHDAATLQAIHTHGPARYVLSGSIAVRGGTMRVRARLQDAQAGGTLVVVERSGDAADIVGVGAALAAELRRRTGYAPFAAADVAQARALLPGEDELVPDYSRAVRARYRFDAPAVVDGVARVIAEEPDFAPARSLNMWVLRTAGKPYDAFLEGRIALDHADQLPARRRDDIEIAWYTVQQQHDRSVEVARRMMSARPADTLFALDAATLYTEAARYDEAAELVERLKRLPPPESDDPIIDWAEASIAQARGQLPAALVAVRRGVARAREKRTRLALIANLALEGKILSTMVKPDEAIEVLAEATTMVRELELPELGPFFQLKDSYFALARLADARRVVDQIHELRGRIGTSPPAVYLAMHTFDQAALFQAAGDVQKALASCSLARFVYVAGGELPAWLGSGEGLARAPRDCVTWARGMQQGTRRPTVEASRAEVDAARRASGPELRTALERLGDALWDAGKYAEAEARFDEVASLYESTGQHRRAGWARVSMAEVVLAGGDPARARGLATQAIDAFRQSSGMLGEAYANHVIALAYLEEGDPAAARGAIAPFEEYVQTLENVEYRVRMLAWAAVVKRDLALADQALADAVAIDNYTTITRARLMRARVLHQLGRAAEAQPELELVVERARHLGRGEWERQAKRLLARR